MPENGDVFTTASRYTNAIVEATRICQRCDIEPNSIQIFPENLSIKL